MPSEQAGADGAPPLFTDFSYDNLGFPRNPENPTYRMPKEFNPDGAAWIDPGLGGFLAKVPRFAHLAEQNLGKHKVPTLRNADKRPRAGFVKAFGHNGVFKSLKETVHFYNTRDVLPPCEATPDAKPGLNCWARPEVAAGRQITPPTTPCLPPCAGPGPASGWSSPIRCRTRTSP